MMAGAVRANSYGIDDELLALIATIDGTGVEARVFDELGAEDALVATLEPSRIAELPDRLVNGVRLPPGPGYLVRDNDRAWATPSTVEWFAAAFEAMRGTTSPAV